MKKDSMVQLKHCLGMVQLGKTLSDESAYALYQVGKILFECLTAECHSKLSRYLLQREGIQSPATGDLENCCEDCKDFNDEVPF